MELSRGSRRAATTTPGTFTKMNFHPGGMTDFRCPGSDALAAVSLPEVNRNEEAGQLSLEMVLQFDREKQ